MKTNTALLWTGLFTLAGAVTISCGGSSDEDNGNGSTAGTTSNTAGTTSSTAGTTGNGGTTSTGGTTSNTAGTTNNTAGTTNNTAGTNNNNGGAADPGTGGAADPGTGGAAADGCPASMPADGSMCMQGDSPFQGCDYGDMNCRCRRANGGQMREWQCEAAQGAGGAGNFGDAVCPADAQDGDPCTGTGLCAGQQCFCNNEETNCF
jgi:hypothetical protein